MKKNLLAYAALLSLALFAATGCNKNTHEAVMEDAMDVMEDMVDTMKSVKDEASAKAAAGKMKELKTKMEEIEKRGKALGEPPADLKKKYEPKVQELAQKMMAEGMRIAMNPELSKHMDGAMK